MLELILDKFLLAIVGGIVAVGLPRIVLPLEPILELQTEDVGTRIDASSNGIGGRPRPAATAVAGR